MKQPQINYKILRILSPETARTAVLQYLKSNNGNISSTAKVFGVQRLTIYDILRKSRQRDLKDRSKAPRRVANKTPMKITLKIIRSRKRTGYGARRLSDYLLRRDKIKISVSTIKGIIKRENF